MKINKLYSEVKSNKNKTMNENIDIEPFTGDMWRFLLQNALRCLTEEQMAGLCFDVYIRSEMKESIDAKIEKFKNATL